MGAGDLAQGGGGSDGEVFRRDYFFRFQALAEELIFVEGKVVLRRERKAELIVVEDLHGQRLQRMEKMNEFCVKGRVAV